MNALSVHLKRNGRVAISVGVPMSTLRKRVAIAPPDYLSDWIMPPPSALDMRPMRVFDTRDEALAFLETLRDIVSDAQRARPVGA